MDMPRRHALSDPLSAWVSGLHLGRATSYCSYTISNVLKRSHIQEWDNDPLLIGAFEPACYAGYTAFVCSVATTVFPPA